MHARNIPTTLLLVLLAAGSAVFAEDRRDSQLANDITRSIDTHPQLSIFDDVCARIENGVVTLTGKVTAEYKKNDVSRIVGRLDGVREVRNLIGVLPASPFDDELRYRASRAIYSNPAFWSYASMARPPIHVIVERAGHADGRRRVRGGARARAIARDGPRRALDHQPAARPGRQTVTRLNFSRQDRVKNGRMHFKVPLSFAIALAVAWLPSFAAQQQRAATATDRAAAFTATTGRAARARHAATAARREPADADRHRIHRRTRAGG